MRASSAFSKGIFFLLSFVTIFSITSQNLYAQAPVINSGGTLQSPFAKVFEKASPSIVLIQVKGEMDDQQDQMPWPFIVPQQNQRQQRPYTGMGSGVIIDTDGHILTNNHVIVKPDRESVADEITVVFNDNEEYPAEVVGRDPESDLAVVKLKLNGKKLPEDIVAELGDSEALKPGDYAIAIGNPLGLERTITVGVISAVGRYKGINPMGADALKFKNFIQTDALINPGNSGGALLDINGKVIGINDMYIAETGIGFAIPINMAKNVMKQIIATGTVKRGALGIQISDVEKEVQEALELQTREGVFIQEVIPGTPAEKAGLTHGDIIVTLNGKKMKNSNEFLLQVGSLPPGEKINIGVVHDKKLKNITLELADRSQIITDSGSTVNWRGIHVVDLGSSQVKNLNLEGIDSGVVVVKIDDGSPAAETTLAAGDVIVEINNQQIEDTNDFSEIKKNNDSSKKPILIYRLRKQSNGRIIKGFVAVKSQ